VYTIEIRTDQSSIEFDYISSARPKFIITCTASRKRTGSFEYFLEYPEETDFIIVSDPPKAYGSPISRRIVARLLSFPCHLPKRVIED
jgi:hypothetical protein